MSVPDQHPVTSRPWRARRVVLQPQLTLRVAGLLGAVLWLIWAWWTGWSSPINAVDIAQPRYNTALPAPRGDLLIEQTFIPGRDGLAEIGLLLVRYDNRSENGQGQLTLTLLDDRGQIVRRHSVRSDSVSGENQEYTLRFPPQTDSAGRRYTLRLSGDADNTLSGLGYDLDVYADGALKLTSGSATESVTTVRDLRFTTRYHLSWAATLRILGGMLVEHGPLLLLILLVLFLPGCLLLLMFQHRTSRWDTGGWWGAALALGAAGWPVLWSWVTRFNGRFSALLLGSMLILGWGTVLYLAWRRRNSAGRPADRPRHSADRPSHSADHGLLLLLLLVALSVRLLAVRDLAFPPWVDASRHALITRITADNGQILRDYQPYWSADQLPYHYGFHTIAATVTLLSDEPLPTVLLMMGQLLNALVPLAVYAAGWLLTRRRSIGLLAAFLVALPFFFPAYYATWGRLTQLAGMLILPILLGLTWRLVRGARGWQRSWPLIALLAAGLFLVHFRVFFFYLPFAALAGLVGLALPGRVARRWPKLLVAGGLATLLVLPRLAQLIQKTDPVGAVQGRIPNYNAFPNSYIQVGWEKPFLLLGGAGLLLVALGLFRRRAWAFLSLVLASWVATLFLLLSGDRLGLPETYLINTNSFYITLFLPLALFLAITGVYLFRWLRIGGWPITFTGGLIAGAALAAAAVMGVQQQITILNPGTILAQPQDLAGLEWAREHLPPDARVAVNSWLWLGTTYAGGDGGAWLVPLTGRDSTTPPVDYIYNHDLNRRVAAFNEAALVIEDWSDPAAVEFLDQHRVTHLYVGARGGFLEPSALARNPRLALLYSQDGVFIFAVQPDL